MNYKFPLKVKGRDYNCEWNEDEPYPKARKYVRVHGFIFDDSGKLLVVYFPHKKKYNLPGGGLEDGESFIECLKRECEEEADVEIKNIKEMGYLRAVEKTNSKKVHYGIRYLASVKKLNKRTADPHDGKFTKRKFIGPEEFEKHIGWGSSGKLQIKRAISLLTTQTLQ